MEKYDLVVVGSGPGGYVAAIRGSQLGLKVALVEKEKSLGGTCLNVGCIPSKALLDSSKLYEQIVKDSKEHGILTEGTRVDWDKMLKRKNKVVAKTVKGVEFLIKKNNISILQGIGSFVDEKTLSILQNDKTSLVTANNFLIATGSKVGSLPNIKIDHEYIINSSDALSLKEIPSSLIIVGGGIIGCELGSVYARLGSQVTIIEYTDSLISNMDQDLGSNLHQTLKEKGIEFHFKSQVEKCIVNKSTDSKDKKVKIKGLFYDKNIPFSFNAQKVLICVGRIPQIDRLNLEKIGVETDKKGFIKINNNYQTNISNIYAIGDVVGGVMLAHKASEEGIACVEKISGNVGHINYSAIPSVVYTWPEVASVGLSERELIASNKSYTKGIFPFSASGRARAANEKEGFVKILSDDKTDEILGIHIIGPRAADLIAEAVIALEYRASSEDIFLTSHAHPTYAEAIKEASLACFEGKALHL